MNANLSLGRFRSEIGGYSHFRLYLDEPLNPLSFSASFDNIMVVLSASPYIALKNSAGHLCLSHIQSIEKVERDGKTQSYMLSCKDLAPMRDYPDVRFVLECRQPYA